MTAQYLVLAIVLAVTLNHRNRFVRAAGTLLAAIGLSFIVLSVYLADTDGTFAAAPAADWRPLLLNAQGVVALAAIIFLLWAAWRQLRRSTAPVPLQNTSATFGLVSRYAHWATATLMLCMIPIGLFMKVLPESSPDRAVFLAVHMTLGVTVLGLVILRLAWLAFSRAPTLLHDLRPWERRLAHAVHFAIYALILSLPLTGIMLTVFGGGELRFYGVTVLLPVNPGAEGPWRMLHNQLLPFTFYAVFAMHLAGVVKHHFISGRKDDVRRMLG
jgi:cytochrome b561